MSGMPGVKEYASNKAAFYLKGSLFYCSAAVLPSSKLTNPLFPFVMNSKLNLCSKWSFAQLFASKESPFYPYGTFLLSLLVDLSQYFKKI